MLLLVAGVTVVACIPAVAGIPADVGVPLVPHVASLPAICGVLGVLGIPFVAGVLAFACIQADPGVHILADVFHTLLSSVHCLISHIRLWTVTKNYRLTSSAFQAQQSIFTITLVSYIKEICSLTVL